MHPEFLVRDIQLKDVCVDWCDKFMRWFKLLESTHEGSNGLLWAVQQNGLLLHFSTEAGNCEGTLSVIKIPASYLQSALFGKL